MLVGEATIGSWPVTAKVGVSRRVVLPLGMPVPLTVRATAVLPVELDAVAGETSVTAKVSTLNALARVDHPASGLLTVTATGPADAPGATVTDTEPAVEEPPFSVTAPKVTPLPA